MRGHHYGPHDPTTAHVYVDLKSGRGSTAVNPDDLLVRPADFVRLAPGLTRQRVALNTLAHERSRHDPPTLL